MDWKAILATIFGTGVLTTVCTVLLQQKFTRDAREASYLRAQLEKLYGPLMFYVTQNETFFAHCIEIHDLASEEWGGRAMSERERQDHVLSIEIRNDFMGMVEKNNAKMVDVLINAHGLIDADDIELFGEFAKHHTRMQVERDEAKNHRVPFELAVKMQGISYMPKESAERVKRKFYAKRDRLKELGG